MSCEREQQKVTDLQDALSLAQDQCASGIKGACGKIGGIRGQLVKAQAALAECKKHVPPPTTPPPPPRTTPPPPPRTTPPPPPVPCAALRQQVTDLEDALSLAQDQCAAGIKGACGQIAGLRGRLAKAKDELDKCLFPRTLKVIRPGDTTKANPYTIVIIANPALETPTGSGKFAIDPIMTNTAAFDTAVTYINDNLFGKLAEQRETFLASATLEPKIRVLSLIVHNLPANSANALVGQNPTSNITDPRRASFLPFLAHYGLEADVIYAVTASTTHTRASAFAATDDETRGGVAFTLDGTSLNHRFFSSIPGTVAISTTSASLTAIHEFGHAASSFNNGFVTDLYVDLRPAANTINAKDRVKTIPTNFGNYNGTTMLSDQTRDGLGYPPGWLNYHCELLDAKFPAVMDNFFSAFDNVPTHCQHDRITRQFLIDRISAKISR